MTSDKLKAKVEAYRKWLTENSGGHVIFGPNGPANMGLIDALSATVEAQDRRIKALEDRLSQFKVADFH